MRRSAERAIHWSSFGQVITISWRPAPPAVRMRVASSFVVLNIFPLLKVDLQPENLILFRDRGERHHGCDAVGGLHDLHRRLHRYEAIRVARGVGALKRPRKHE